MMIGPIAFATPLLLLALIVLPVLWLLLRAVPPAPIRRRFPGVALLLGLQDDEAEADKTPWWLLLLRLLAVAAAIFGFAGPVLNPRAADPGRLPLLVVMDGGWAEARDWGQRRDLAAARLTDAARDGRSVAVIRLTDAAEPTVLQSTEAWAGRLQAMEPQPWLPGLTGDWIKSLPAGDFDSYWLSDGLNHGGRAELATILAQRGQVTVYQTTRPVFILHPAEFEGGVVKLSASRLPATDAAEVEVSARGPDPAGIERELAKVKISFAAGALTAAADLPLPPELRNRITRFEIIGQHMTGAVSLTDDSLKRRKVALIGGGADAEGLQLLAPTHYLRQALEPVADLLEGPLSDLIPANPDVVILADVARLTQGETDALLDWLDQGGLLLRFAGPKLAASDEGRLAEDPLMPVRLREGGRTVGGAMSWGEPKPLAPFPEGSPFHGLAVPGDVTVTEQVLAQPDPDLTARTIAALADGTPLVTRKEVGQGQVVLFHVTANAEWSSLPLSGLFVQMLERLAVSTRPAEALAEDLAGQVWVPQRVLDATGAEADAGEVPGVQGEVLAGALAAGPGIGLPPGLYAGGDRRIALNAVNADTVLTTATWPIGTVIEGPGQAQEQALQGWLLAFALLLLSLDVLAALLVAGKLGQLGARLAVLVLAALPAPDAQAQNLVHSEADARAIAATQAVVLAYVITGDSTVDETSAAGLLGLGYRLWERTSVEPDAPIGVDLETDELAFYPFLYWPVTTAQQQPSAGAYARLNDYLRTGGMILFDTRDGDIAGLGGATPEGQALQSLAAGLDIPPLEVIPEDHVLTRSFYLLQDFPGRYTAPGLWVEAAPPDAELAEGMPFRNLNDGVTPVVIGGNDWAGAWAVDTNAMPLFPVGRGYAGERQREIAYRFGINLIMHVLTGNYKSDQVHVPALLERLGQ